MTFNYTVDRMPIYRDTEYGVEDDGSIVDEITYEPSLNELKKGLTQIIAEKFFNNDFDAVEKFIDELDEINELAETFKEDLKDLFREEALENYYEAIWNW